MSIDLEIRKLPLKEKTELIRFLEEQESWKKLMAIIPQNLHLNNYKCDISLTNPAKYRSEHFHIIQNASNMTKRFCSEILLREWGTSGRVRPALGHLKYLLEKAQLFHAADYVTVEILRQKPVARPTKGPAAPILFNSEELEDTETKQIQKLLDEINYPSSAIENINKSYSIDTNLNYTTKDVPKVIPKIIISPDIDETKPTFNVPLVVPKEKNKTESDLIKFSEPIQDNANVPNLSSLLTNESSSNNIPAVIQNLSQSSETISSENNRPDLSSLLSTSSDDNIPALSGLSLSSTSSFESSTNVPALSHLLDSKSPKNTRSCPSPLPNLSLNTPLPHFSYYDLKTATNNFDETPVAENGRFLGSGSFGRVYLGYNLLDQPVAVKKLMLENEEVVKVEDRVTKQFIAEVEILSKYKHTNLVTILGYSCDGLTYCLIYEYVSGGPLNIRLQKHELFWTERLFVALETARAISYLHTAYSTPLIHRDVKSANILLDVNNKPKLCDFGLIKHSISQNTQTGTTILGTSAYMAPEALRLDVSIKLDTFSFGVVLLELLTSLPPIDRNREGIDLVTHVDEFCQSEIKPLLDYSCGSWCANNVDFGQNLYKIALECLKEKKQLRPPMSTVCKILEDLIQKSITLV